jgi:hypothetical protein
MEVLAEAGQLLGYKPDAVNMSQSILDRMEGECEIEAALSKLEMRPFSRNSVQKYKARMIHKTERAGSNWFVLRMHRAGGEDILWFLGVAGAILLLASAIGYFSGIQWLGDHQQIADFRHLGWFRQTLPRLALTIWAVFGVCSYARLKYAFSRTAEWTKTAISSYTKPIPEFAVLTAILLKKELPAASFHVEELSAKDTEERTYHNPRPVRANFDPFLLMTYKGHELYMEVWREDKFDGKRIK